MSSVILTINVCPDNPPALKWSGSAADKISFCRLPIHERLQHLVTNSHVQLSGEPWAGVKNKSKSDLLRVTGQQLIKNKKYVEAIECFNSAMRVAADVS